jgi:hypothetical protein
LEFFNNRQYQKAIHQFIIQERLYGLTSNLAGNLAMAYYYLGDLDNAYKYLKSCSYETLQYLDAIGRDIFLQKEDYESLAKYYREK